MKKTLQKMTPNIATHPGEVLNDELKARNIKQNEFSINTGITRTILNELIKGKRNLTAETALILEKSLDIPAKFWMDFQVQFDIDLARIKEKSKEKTEWIDIWNKISRVVSIPILKKEGLLTDSVKTNIETTKRIFAFENVAELENNFLSSFGKPLFKKSEKLQVNFNNLFTWEKISRYKIADQEVNPYLGVSDNLIKQLKEAIYINQNLVDTVKKILNEHGIKFLICQKYDKTPVDGMSFWSGKNPAIILTLRKSNIDNFAFTLFHELGHIKLHIEKDTAELFIDIEKKIDNSQKEKEANVFASESLISKNIWEKISPNIQLDAQIKFYGELYRIHPYIIFGRKCWEIEKFNLFTSISKDIL